MLLAFVGLIMFGSWYTMKYSDDEKSIDAEFSLILFYTTMKDKATGIQTYTRYWALKFPDICSSCQSETIPSDECLSVIEFCDVANVERADVYIYLVSTLLKQHKSHVFIFLLAIQLWSCGHYPALLRNNLRRRHPQ